MPHGSDKVEARLRQLFSGHRDTRPDPEGAAEAGAGAASVAPVGGEESGQRGRGMYEARDSGLEVSRPPVARPRRRKPAQVTLAQIEGTPSEEVEGTLHVVRFRLGDGEFAVALSAVREVQRIGVLTPVPGGPPTLLGLMNLRGAVVPVFDIRRILGSAPATPGAQARVLVFGGAEATSLAFVVDGILGTDRVQMPLAEPMDDGALLLAEGCGETTEGHRVTVLSAASLLEIGARC